MKYFIFFFIFVLHMHNALAQDIIISETFEQNPFSFGPTNYTEKFGYPLPTGFQFIDYHSVSSTNSLRITTSASTSTDNTSNLSITDFSNYELRYSYYQNSTIEGSDIAGRFSIRDSNNNIMWLIQIYNNPCPGNQLNFYDGTDNHCIGNITYDQTWINVSVKVNHTANECDVYINDTLRASYDPCTTSTEDPHNLRIVPSGGANTEDYYVDNLVLCQGECIFENEFGFDNCTDTNVPALNFSIYNEDYPSVHEPSKFYMSTEYWGNTKSINRTFNYASEDPKSSYQFCMNTNINNIRLNSFIRYESEISNRYILSNFSINTTGQVVDIYNFNDSASLSDLRLTIRDKDTYEIIPNTIGKLQRNYLGEGVWRTVQMDMTDDFGLLFYNVYEEDTDYRLIFTDLNNNVLQQSGSLKFSCDTGICSLNTLIDQDPLAGVFSYLNTQASYDNSTDTVDYQYSVSDATSKEITTEVTKINSQGVEIIICTDTKTGAAASGSCNVSSYTGPFNIKYKEAGVTVSQNSADKSGESIGSFSTQFDTALWTIAIFMTIVGFGAFSPGGVIITSILGLIITYFLQLFTPVTLGFITTATVIGLVLAFKVRK